MKMSPLKKFVLLVVSHAVVALIGFAAGIYALPILTAPPSPAESELESVAVSSQYSGRYRRDLKDSDALHWGEGTVSVGRSAISLRGNLAPSKGRLSGKCHGGLEGWGGSNPAG